MITKSIFFIVLLLLVSFDAAASDLSFGVGAGALYGCIGLNIGLQRETYFRYVSASCPGVGYSTVDGWEISCGVGVGWIWANIL